MNYEYVRLVFDYGDLGELNRLGSAGFRVVAVNPAGPSEPHDYFALLEREVKP